jgi:hypothetical protein
MHARNFDEIERRLLRAGHAVIEAALQYDNEVLAGTAARPKADPWLIIRRCEIQKDLEVRTPRIAQTNGISSSMHNANEFNEIAGTLPGLCLANSKSLHGGSHRGHAE